jgi:cysteine desulfurase/selenocysteine lyase
MTMLTASPVAATQVAPPHLIDVRSEFPGVPQDWAYLDAAATAQKPRAVIDAISNAYARDYATVHRGVYARSARMTEAFEQARDTVARFLGAAANEIVFVRGATEAINLVANSWGSTSITAGDRILLSTLEHHSNIVPWRLLADRVGAEIDVAPLTADGRIDEAALIAMIGPATRLVAIAHVSNVLGSIADVPAIARAAHARGALLLVDGCQAAPRLALDMKALGADFYAFSGHKLYGPTGIGVLWARREILEAMPPWQGGGAMIEDVSFDRISYADPPGRFEAGTPHIAGVIGLAAAVDWVSAVGITAIEAHEAALTAIARAELEALGAHVFGPAQSAGILSFAVGEVHPHDVATILDEGRVAIRAGHHCAQPLMRALGVPATARASVSAHSSLDDIGRLVEGVKRVQRIFG